VRRGIIVAVVEVDVGKDAVKDYGKRNVVLFHVMLFGVCLFVIILHSPLRGAQLSYQKPAGRKRSWYIYPISPELPRSSVGGGHKATNPPPLS